MVTRASDGTHEFKVYVPHASRVELVGSFTDWLDGRIPMAAAGDGWWNVRLGTSEVGSGDHKFMYLIDSGVWMTDFAAGGVERGEHGGWVSLLHVPDVQVEPMFRIAA